ncbi:putative secreted protein (Por secretion system target) [Chitinophaga niastensis]|uniref:Putative secreted protein (Por secretion system target) n=1 Tax=Chitinophaga niastensis TaxID=536980 RepID=A0A2P8HC66_CHINA|nr:glycoside hydrolase family 19 protein [Chitinophaga niastensis]PSL43839.1 putative secreted protein (Por secretion system target) [Chitinophaga niastensis]
MKTHTRYLKLLPCIICCLLYSVLPVKAVNRLSHYFTGIATDTGNPVTAIISSAEWDVIFPHRFNPDDRTGTGTLPTTAAKDFYSYNNFVTAVLRMSNIKALLERRCGTNYYKITRIDKTTGAAVVIRNDAGFNDPQWSTNAIISQQVDYGTFANEGDVTARKRELVAFLANISQETTGGWPTAPGGQFAWGLYFREEQGYEGTNNIGYRDESDTLYPPAPGKSYHGRGPIQISYNYNYGQASELLFGNKNILLANPEMVIQDGALSFQTALWFWMTPQYPKPSCHDVMVPGKWTPTATQQAGGLKPGFGATVNIINGGVECGGPQENTKVLSRIGHYQRYATIKQVSLELNGGNNTANCGCANMARFSIDNTECSSLTSITFSQPANGLITTTALIPVTLAVSRNDPRREISKIYITVNGQRYNDSVALWTPPGYKQYTATATAIRNDMDTLTTMLTFAVWNNQTFEGCSNLPAWQSAQNYTTANNIVLYNNNIYRNKWWAGSTSIPGTNDTWELLGACTGQPRTDTGCSGIAAWSASKAYVTNDQVAYANKIYQAKWWTQNNAPDLNNGDGKPWTYMRNCGAAAMRKEDIPNQQNPVVYPNPVNGNILHITFQATPGEKLQLALLHITTLQPLLQKNYVAAHKGNNTVQLDVSHLPTGIWILKITSDQYRKIPATTIIKN